MVDFSNINLCGASIELNDVLGKLDDAKAEITAAIDFPASEAAAAFGAAQNELKALTDKLQAIEIPTLPKLNLQAEIGSLLSQVPGSVGYAVALAKIGLEFKSDIEAKGLTLETLVSAAAVGSDLICKVVPNLEKVAGSIEAAVEKPAAVKQAAAKAVTEAASKITQNIDIVAKTKELAEKVSGFKTTSVPPAIDTPKFKLVSSSIIKIISTGAGGETPVAVQPTTVAERKNYVPDDKAAGFSYKKTSIIENFSLSGDVGTKIDIVDGYPQLHCKHKPIGDKIIVGIYPGENYTKTYIGQGSSQTQPSELGLTEKSSDANKQFYYENARGRHLAFCINEPRLKGFGADWYIFGNTFIFTSPVTLSDHPGNINSGGYYTHDDPDKFFSMGKERMLRLPVRIPPTIRSDSKLNKAYGGLAVRFAYTYLEKYDPDYEPAPG